MPWCFYPVLLGGQEILEANTFHITPTLILIVANYAALKCLLPVEKSTQKNRKSEFSSDSQQVCGESLR